MALSNELVSQFVKVTKDNTTEKHESTVYGTIAKHGNKTYVKIDGSDLLTPVSTTTDTVDGERVTVMIKNHTATATGNVSSPAARIDTVNEISGEVSTIKADYAEITELVAEKATIGDLYATNAEIENLKVKNAEIENLVAEKATIEDLVATNATITNLEAENANIKNLVAEKATVGELTAASARIGELEAGKADIVELNAAVAKIIDLEANYAKVDVLEADVADINTLMFGSATGDTLHTNFANSVVSLIGDGMIKNAMILSLDAGKINAGNINTSNVQIVGDDNRMFIKDGTIQIKDDNNTTRVQIGKDNNGDYSIVLCDTAGNIMFSETGLTAEGIKNSIIRNDMVAANANIQSEKLDIAHLFYTENEETGVKQLDTSAVKYDGKSLDVYFKSLTDADAAADKKLTSQGTQISAIQGQISSKIWEQSITGTNLLLDSAKEYTNNKDNMASYSPAIPLTAGLKYTASMCVTPASENVNFRLFASNSYIRLITMTVSGTDKQVISGTFEMKYYTGMTPDVDPQYADIQVRRYPNDGSITGDSTIHWIKIEVGEKASDWTPEWTPAPEDSIAMSTKYSELKQELGSFKSTVSETYSTKNELKDAKTELNQTIEGFKLSVSETYATNTSVNTLSSKHADLAQTVDNFKTTVETEYVTDDKLTAEKSSIIDQTSDSITQAVSSLTIGGRNILLNSSFSAESSHWTCRHDSNSFSLDFAEKGNVTCAHISLGGRKYVRQTITKKLQRGTNYTMSGWIMVENVAEGTSNPYVRFYHEGHYTKDGVSTWFGYGNTGKKMLDATKIGTWQHVTWTFKTDSKLDTVENQYMYLDTNDVTGDLYFYNFKLEKGEKATDWTPAPEDHTEELSDVSSAIYGTIEELNTSIEALPGQIKASVSAEYVTQTDYGDFKTDTESTLEQLPGSLELKITQSTEVAKEYADGQIGTALEQYEKHFTFDDNGITIETESNGSSASINMDSDGIVFEKDGSQLGKWTGDYFYTGNIFVETDEQARFGSFAFEPRPDGSLMFRKIN